MAAYNFQKRFVGPIKAGTKTQTIRRIGKRRHARPGEMIQLYTGMRTKVCKKIVRDVVCLKVSNIEIEIQEEQFGFFRIDGSLVPVRDWELIARKDGFDLVRDFHQCFKAMHGTGVFSGVLIQWGKA